MQEPPLIISRLDTAYNWVLTLALLGIYCATDVFRSPVEIETFVSFFFILIVVVVIAGALTVPYWLLLWWLHHELNKRELLFGKYWILQNCGHLIIWGLLVCSTIVFSDRFLIVLLWPVVISSLLIWNGYFLRTAYSKKQN